MLISSVLPKNIEVIHQKVMKKIQNSSLCQKGEEVIRVWRFGDQPIHAGQIKGVKTLPNGNKQVRITTAYAGSNSTLALDTRVYSPSGELLKAYHGIRGTEATFTNKAGEVVKHIPPTRSYGNTAPEIREIIRQEKSLNNVTYQPI